MSATTDARMAGCAIGRTVLASEDIVNVGIGATGSCPRHRRLGWRFTRGDTWTLKTTPEAGTGFQHPRAESRACLSCSDRKNAVSGVDPDRSELGDVAAQNSVAVDYPGR